MNLPDLSIRRPITVTMMMLIITVLGFVTLSRIGIDFFPDLQFPEVTVLTTYPGAASHEIETIVTRPLEEAVAAAEGVRKIKSRSQEGVSIIQAEFMPHIGTLHACFLIAIGASTHIGWLILVDMLFIHVEESST